MFALPTVAFFMCAIGIFIIANIFSSLFLRHKKAQRKSVWRKGLAVSRYLSYRGFHVGRLQWNSAPVGVLLLGAAGTIFFFCTSPVCAIFVVRIRADAGYRHGSSTAAVLLG